MFHILIVEDETDIRKMMAEYLTAYGYHTFEACDGAEALDLMESHYIDLLITDVMMPKLDGFTLTEELRKSGYELPILMITAKETMEDKEKGFNNGTDDYMVKPIILKEMLLRVKSLLKRAKSAAEPSIVLKNSSFYFETQLATVNCENIELPKKEFNLLFCLLSNPGKIFTRQQLLDEVWGYDSESGEGTVNVHISRLRERLSGCKDFEIVTVKGLGIKVVLL